MLPEHFYMTDLGKMAYVVLYLPLVLGSLWFIYRKFKKARLVIVVLAPVLLALPLWDVYMIGRDAERLCKEQGGLHVYKVVEADSFRGGGDIVKLSEYGFAYAESFGLGGKKFRYTSDGIKWFEQEIDEFITRYQIGE
jgi:hypothetical protein